MLHVPFLQTNRTSIFVPKLSSSCKPHVKCQLFGDWPSSVLRSWLFSVKCVSTSLSSRSFLSLRTAKEQQFVESFWFNDQTCTLALSYLPHTAVKQVSIRTKWSLYSFLFSLTALIFVFTGNALFFQPEISWLPGPNLSSHLSFQFLAAVWTFCGGGGCCRQRYFAVWRGGPLHHLQHAERTCWSPEPAMEQQESGHRGVYEEWLHQHLT